MNVREGMRRLGMSIGVVGGIAGAISGFLLAQDTWNQRAAAERFNSLATYPRLLKSLNEAPPGFSDAKNFLLSRNLEAAARNDPDSRVFGTYDMPKNKDDVTKITFAAGLIESIELANGESLYRAVPLSRLGYFYALILPVIGFLVPWGAIRTLTWIGTGFFRSSPPA